VTEALGNPDLHLVDSVEDAQAFLRWLGERRPILAIDTETTGLDWWTPHFTRLIQFGDGATGWAVPVRNWRGVAEAALTRVQEDRLPTAWWNAKFDAHALENEGLPLPYRPKAHDGLVMHHLLHNGERHGLKAVAGAAYGDQATVGDQWLKQRKREMGWDWATVPETEPAYWGYAALDTVLTARLVEGMWPLPPVTRAAYEREMGALWIMYGAESRGIRVDTTYAGLLRDKWLDEAADMADVLKSEGIQNPNSNRQITDALAAAGWEPDEFTPSGAAKLDKAVLLQLQATFPGDMAERILKFRRLLKWSTAYLKPFSRAEGGIIHPSINVLGARTGRMSISNPPLQQLPARGEGGKLIRTAVLPASEGEVLYACDFDGQELRYHAHVSNSAHMIEAFRQGIDPHAFTASIAYGVPIERVTKEQRSAAKNTRFAGLYGAGPAKIAATAGVPVEVIETLYHAIEERFPEEREFVRVVEAKAKERWADEGEPYVMTWGGRKVVGEGDKLYALLNYTIQGSCADILKDRLIALNAEGLDQYIVVPVHDEVVFSFPEAEAAELGERARTVMEMPDTFRVPLTVGIDGPLNTWGDKY
jgi:DNA polymerase-1